MSYWGQLMTSDRSHWSLLLHWCSEPLSRLCVCVCGDPTTVTVAVSVSLQMLFIDLNTEERVAGCREHGCTFCYSASFEVLSYGARCQTTCRSPSDLLLLPLTGVSKEGRLRAWF